MNGWSLTRPPLPLLETAQESHKGADDREQEMSGGTEGEDATPEAAVGGNRSEGGQEFSVKEADYSEGCVKLKIGLGTKRTKKPPKILENYVCRPHIRTSLRQGRGSGSGSQGGRSGAKNEVTGANQSQSPTRGKDRKDAMILDQSSSLASTALSCSPSSTAPDTSATAAEAPVSLSAKRAPPKLAHKAGMKDHFSEGPAKLNQNGNKLPGSGKTDKSPPSSSLSPTPAASPPSPTKQHSTVQEGAKVTNGGTPRDEKSTVPNQGNSSGSAEKLNKRNATSNINRLKQQKARACKLHSLSDSHVSSVGNSAAISSVHNSCSSPALSDASTCLAASKETGNDQGKPLPFSQEETVTAERDEAEDTKKSNSLSATNTGTSSTMMAANSNKSTSGKVHSHALSPIPPINSDQSDGQVPAGEMDSASSLTSPTSGCITNLSERSFGSVQWKDNNTGVDNPKDLSVNKPTVASEQMKVDSAGSKGSPSGQSRRSASLQQDCVITPPAASSKCPSPEQDRRPLKKRKGRCPRWTKTVHQAQMLTPDKSAGLESNSTSPQQVVKPVPPRRPVGRPPKCSQFPVAQPKKRGRPRLNLSKSNAPASAGSHKQSTSLTGVMEERDTPAMQSKKNVTPPNTLKRKRGRPKLLSSATSSGHQPLKYPSNGDTVRVSQEALEGNGQSSSKGSGQLMMKSIIGKINKMRTKRRKWVLNQLLSGQGGGERVELPSGKKTGEVCGLDPSPVPPIPSLATSFGGKLGPQINVSKKGTIYMGKRRGRKPKVPNGDSKFSFSQDSSPSLGSFCSSSQSAGASGLFSNPSFKNQSAIALNQSKQLFSHTSSSPGASLFQNTSSFLAPSQKKSSSYREQHQLRHDRKTSLSSSPLSMSSLNELKDTPLSPLSETHSQETLPSDSSAGTDNSMSDWVDRAAGGKGAGGATPGRGTASLTSEAWCSRWTFGVTPHRSRERSAPAHSSMATGPAAYPRPQPSRSPPPVGGQPQKHKHKCKGRVHSCSSYKLKGQKHRCKRKYLQLKASRQDPDFMVEVEKLMVRLSNIHLVHQRSVPETVLDSEGSGGGGGNSIGASRHSHTHHCIPQNLLPTIFQINFSGYYSPHLACPYDSLHYVRKPELKKKHSGHPPKFREVSPTDVSLLQGLGFPLSHTGYYRAPHRIPYTPPVGLGYYKRHPSSEGLYTQPEHSSPFSSHPSYPHPHHSYPLYMHPSKLHKKKHKLMRQDCGGEGVRSPVMYPGFSSESAYRWASEYKRKHRHRHGDRSVEEREEERGGECDVAGGTDKTETRNPDFKEMMGSQWRHRYGSAVNRNFIPSSLAPSFSSPSLTESCVFKEATLNWMGSSKSLHQASGDRQGFPHKPWLRSGVYPSPSSDQAEGKAGDSSPGSESEEDPESSPARTDSVPALSRPHHVNLFTNAFSQGTGARFGSLSASSSSTGGISELSRTNRRDQPTPSKSRETGRKASPDSDSAEVPENGVHFQHRVQHRSLSLLYRHAHRYSSLPGQSLLPAPPAAGSLKGRRLSSCRQMGRNAGFPGALTEFAQSPSPYGSRPRASSECSTRSSKSSLNHLNKILRAKKMQRQAVTGNNVVKKRGPGRPRKYPLPSPSPPPADTTTQDPHPKDAARGGGVVEEAGQGPFKRRKKRRCYERGEAEDREEQKRHEEDRRMRGGGKKAEFPQTEHLSSRSLEGGKLKSQTSIGSVPSNQVPPTQSDSQWESRMPQPPMKKFERAGLYSDVYKTEDPESQLRQLSRDTLEYIPGEHEHGLMPAPIHVGKYLRLKRIDFQLPYDIQWLWKHNQLHRKPDPPAYRKITSNVFVDVKPISEQTATQCACKPLETSAEKGCVDGDCLNRRMCVECVPSLCPCGEQCGNQALQRRQGVRGLERCRGRGTGWALRTPLPLRPGQLISEYLGEVVSQQEFRRRMTARHYGPNPQYSLTLSGGMVIDSHRMGNEARFIQHSCKPNCEVQKWSVNGIYRLGVFALRHISSGVELTLNYSTHQAEGQVCKYSMDECESPRDDLVQPVMPSNQQQRDEGGNTLLQRPADTDTQTSRKQESSAGSSRCSPCLKMKALSSRDREIVLTRGIFLVRNYEAVRQKQEQLWREEEFERRRERDEEKNSWIRDGHDAGSCVKTGSQKHIQEPEVNETGNLTHMCKEICDIMTRYKDSAGHILAAPLLNLRSRKRKLHCTESDLEPLDLSTVRRQIISGHYMSLEDFDKDMLRVFLSAEKYYGKKSAVGRDVCRLRRAYHNVRRNAAIQLGDAEGGATIDTTAHGAHNRDPDVHSCHHDDQQDSSQDERMVQCEQGTPPCGLSGKQRGEVCFSSSLILHSALDRIEAQRKRLDMVVWKLLQHQPSTDTERLSIMHPPTRQPPPNSTCGAESKTMRAEAKRTEG
ncbi:histone-lysine N-methyltransferase ASH1L-like isoform X3 [Clupea harengus]|uniref:Histone-lysine N-methyltransferase ASH1L-like isoform X3 n=1 Tax=Clupea harengus TaxID=7950 RepID=A0A6P8G810_CLUHA|nr:histone-lysine N-methyltransferase ASH1L-like isoform X3 [Clupea harengus]